MLYVNVKHYVFVVAFPVIVLGRVFSGENACNKDYYVM